MKNLVFSRIFLHCVALGFIVSGLLLSGRSRVRIAPGMPKQPSCDGCFVYYGIFFLQFFCQADFHAVETAFPNLPSPQGDIEQHHQCEPEGGTDGADIAVLIGP